MNSWSKEDVKYMDLAFQEAHKSHNTTFPNPAVGCVLVRDGKILATGRTMPPGGMHAEAQALFKAGEEAKGATAYVTLEPCSHYGRTPPCSLALINAGIREVVISIVDPNGPVDGKGVRQLRDAGVQVRLGLLEEKAREVYQDYFFYLKHERPRIILKVAESQEGTVNEAPGKRTAITGAEVQKWTHKLRNRVNGVLIGGETLRVDNPDLTPRLIEDEMRRYPESIVWTRQSAKELKNAGVFQLFERGRQAETVVLSTDEIQVVLETLKERGYHSILVEGGTFIWKAFVESGVWDHLYVFTSSKSFPNGQKWQDLLPEKWKEQARIRTFDTVGEDSMVEWVRC